MITIEGIKLYTPTEVCETIGITKQTLFAWFRDGKMQKIKIGGRTFIKADDLRDMINEKVK